MTRATKGNIRRLLVRPRAMHAPRASTAAQVRANAANARPASTRAGRRNHSATRARPGSTAAAVQWPAQTALPVDSAWAAWHNARCARAADSNHRTAAAAAVNVAPAFSNPSPSRNCAGSVSRAGNNMSARRLTVMRVLRATFSRRRASQAARSAQAASTAALRPKRAPRAHRGSTAASEPQCVTIALPGSLEARMACAATAVARASTAPRARWTARCAQWVSFSRLSMQARA